MKIFSLKELLEEDNQIPYTIPGLLPIGLITLSGPQKVGKTWLTLKLAIDASQGNPVFGAFPCQPKRVFYYAYMNERVIPLFDRCLDLGLHTTMSGLGTHLSNCQNGTGIEIEVCKRFNLKHIKKIIEEDKTEILIIDSADNLLNKPETLSDLNYLTWNNGVSIILTTTKKLAQIGFRRASYLSKADWTLSPGKTGELQLLRNGGEDETPLSLTISFSETFTEVLQGWGCKPVTIQVMNTETIGG
jgi:hypothetical protein